MAHRTYDRNRKLHLGNNPYPTAMRLWYEAEAMWTRANADRFNTPAAALGHRRDCLELMRRARLDPEATRLRRLPG